MDCMKFIFFEKINHFNQAHIKSLKIFMFLTISNENFLALSLLINFYGDYLNLQLLKPHKL